MPSKKPNKKKKAVTTNKVSKGGGLKLKSLEGCQDCPAICCHDLSITITRPRTRDEIDILKWQLNYDSTGVYIRNRRWHLIVKGKCQYLDKDNLCTIYENRFDICRNHKPPYCEWYDEWYDVMFTNPEELEAYLKAQKKGQKLPIPKGKWLSKGAGPVEGKKKKLK